MVDLPLHEAVKQNDVAKVKKILESNNTSSIDINAEDEAGITALIEACISGNEEIVNILLEAGCPAQPPAGFRHTPLRGATLCGHAHLVPLLLSYGGDPNALSEGDRTPLMGATFLRKGVPSHRSVLCVKELLKDNRTDPAIVNSFGESALDLAKIKGYEESCMLIQKALNEKE